MRCLAQLPSEQREVIVLKIWHQHTFEMIGELLELSPNTVAGRYRYGMQKLKARLKDTDYERIQFLGEAPAFLDASQQMTQFVRSQWPPAGLATTHYWNPKVELLVSEAAREADDQRRLDQYAEAQRIVWDDAPWIFLWSPGFLIVHAARLQGFTALPTE